jgi:hypothetical protein
MNKSSGGGNCEETPPVLQQVPDPTLCYKLQQCEDESDPEATATPQLQPETVSISQQVVSVITNRAPQRLAQSVHSEQTSQQIVLGTSTSPTGTADKSSEEDILEHPIPRQKNYHLQWIGLSVFILGGFFLLYRIIKQR